VDASNIGDAWKSVVSKITSYIQAHKTIITWVAGPIAALGLGSFIISRIAEARVAMRAVTTPMPSYPAQAAPTYPNAASYPSAPTASYPGAPSAPDSFPVDPAQAPMPAYAQEYEPPDTKPPVQ